MEPNVYTVVMAGGRGERFWPKSRISTPKQLLAIVTENTMIQETVQRVSAISLTKNVLIITNKSQQEQIERLLPQLNAENIVGEPCGRNTAPCIALAAASIAHHDPEAVMIVLPADHVIHDTVGFAATIQDMVTLARTEDVLLTIGIDPMFPATGYGYIHCGQKLPNETGTEFFTVNSFKEKPAIETAQQFVSSGEYLWNSGMFVWRVSVFADALKKHMPDLFKFFQKLVDAFGRDDSENFIESIYAALPSVSIDYGIMEKAERVICAKSRFDWDDVGAWDAVAKHFDRDEDGNVCQGESVGVDMQDCLIVSDDKLVAGIGIKDLIVVATDDAVLICDKNRAQDVKKIVQCLDADVKKRKYL